MGLKNGAKTILRSFKPGLYNHNIKQYNIYIDGELMRYKGLSDDNLLSSPECIAQLAHNYMVGIISDITKMFGKMALGVFVYMDGPKRVRNKTLARAEYTMNTEIIRAYFKDICKNTGFPIVELDCGEAELTMYLQRDQTVDLNVFITADSDMLSICYGHRPRIHCVDDPTKVLTFDDIKIEKLPVNEIIRNSSGDKMIDNNSTYVENTDADVKYKIYDSCLWVNSLRDIDCIGCDFIAERLKLDTNVFRIMICMCGTDYSNNLLTESMLQNILYYGKFQELNKLTTTRHIICALLYYGIKFNGSLKRPPKGNTTFVDCNIDDYEKNVEAYVQYIGTGEMAKTDFNNMCMYKICFEYMELMGMDIYYTKRSCLQMWCTLNSLSDIIKNVDTNSNSTTKTFLNDIPNETDDDNNETDDDNNKF